MKKNNKTIRVIYNWYQVAMYNIANRKVNFPKNTDPSKTYQWRHIGYFIDKITKYDLNDEDVKTLIEILVRYAKEQNILSKGTMLLNLDNILDICKKRLDDYNTLQDDVVHNIKRCCRFVGEESGTYGMDPYDLMLRRKRGGFTNIVSWYQQNDLSDAYIALSKSCNRALNKLEQDERCQFMPKIRMLLLRRQLLKDDDIKEQIQEVMGNDLAVI